MQIKQELPDDYETSCNVAQGPVPDLSSGGTTLQQPDQSDMQPSVTLPGNHMSPYRNLQPSQTSPPTTYQSPPAALLNPHASSGAQMHHPSTMSPTEILAPLPLPSTSYHSGQFPQAHRQDPLADPSSANISYHQHHHHHHHHTEQPDLSRVALDCQHPSVPKLEQISSQNIPFAPEPRVENSVSEPMEPEERMPVPILSEAVFEMQRALILAHEELNVVTKRVSMLITFLTCPKQYINKLLCILLHGVCSLSEEILVFLFTVTGMPALNI